MGVLAPHARQCLNLMPFSEMISVSGFLHSVQRTNSFTYDSSFSLTRSEFNLVFSTRRSFSTSPGVANSFIKYFDMCSSGRLM